MLKHDLRYSVYITIILYCIFSRALISYAQEKHQRSGENTTEIYEMYPRPALAAICRPPEVT